MKQANSKKSYPSRRSPVMARNIVATSQPLATQAGLRMLAMGGNAVDAAIATAATLTIVEPTGNGLGSDAFCILWDGTRLHGLNASGRSPAGWTPDRFAHLQQMPSTGWESVTVPGAVSSWVELSNKFGKLPFAQLLEPAIQYAEQGFNVSPIISNSWAKGAEALGDQPGFAEQFVPGGRTPRVGEAFVNPTAANTLRLIAQSKGRSFYEGEISEKIAAFARQHGAVLGQEDLANHRPEWCGTISQTFDDLELHEIPPNGQGIAALMTLGILNHTQIRDFGADDVQAVHIQIEATKLAYRDLDRYVADPRFMEPVGPDLLLDPAYLKSRAAEIDSLQAKPHHPGAPREGGTVYLSVGDADGMMVSFIQSNYSGFGSGIVVPETGIALQNRGSGFSLEAGHPNQVGPGKQPFHTIIPGFLMKNGKPQMSFGVMGGPFQAQGHVQMLVRTQLWGQDVQSAVEAPRWRILDGVDVACESEMSSSLLSGLSDLGHNITVETPDNAFGFGGAQLISCLPGGGYAAGSDPRKDGQAAGF